MKNHHRCIRQGQETFAECDQQWLHFPSRKALHYHPSCRVEARRYSRQSEQIDARGEDPYQGGTVTRPFELKANPLSASIHSDSEKEILH